VRTRTLWIGTAFGVVALGALLLILLRPAPQEEFTPIPTVGSSASPTAPIVVTADDVVIEGVTVVGPLSSLDADSIGIRAEGTADHPIRDLTIRDCTIRGFNVGIEVRHVENLTIERCHIEDAGYGGIMVYSGVGGRIAGNVIERIGYGIPTDGPDENNAYGISLTRRATADLIGDPRSSDFVVDDNFVADVPLWHGLDTHAGDSITFSNNVVQRCPRPIFITTDSIGNAPRQIDVTGNRLEAATKATGGADLTAITLVNLDTGSIRSNAISSVFPSPQIEDYRGVGGPGSTNVTIGDQTIIP